MKPEIIDYCRNLGMADAFILRVSSTIDLHEACATEPFDDIFISDYVKEDGTRAFESLWLFSKNYVYEAKNFLTEDSLDCLPNRICYWELKKRDYDLKNYSMQSRMNLKTNFRPEYRGEFKASGVNCNYLVMIFTKYFKAQVKASE